MKDKPFAEIRKKVRPRRSLNSCIEASERDDQVMDDIQPADLILGRTGNYDKAVEFLL